MRKKRSNPKVKEKEPDFKRQLRKNPKVREKEVQDKRHKCTSF